MCKNQKEYQCWRDMKRRCYDPQHKNYKGYGGRGITVCDRWLNSFDDFVFDMGLRPSPEYSIDRIDNSKGYYIENCRWATRSEQSRNTKYTKYIEHNGITLCITDWAAKIGISQSALTHRINKYGWGIEEALTTPKGMRA